MDDICLGLEVTAGSGQVEVADPTSALILLGTVGYRAIGTVLHPSLQEGIQS